MDNKNKKVVIEGSIPLTILPEKKEQKAKNEAGKTRVVKGTNNKRK